MHEVQVCDSIDDYKELVQILLMEFVDNSG